MPQVPRLCSCRSVALRGALLVVCLALGGAPERAQTAAALDPFAPAPQAGPWQPTRFQQQAQATPAQYAPQVGFTPPVSGAGDTGYDATNARKKKTAKSKSAAAAQPLAAAAVQPISPYQKPPPPLDSGNGSLAQAPGSTPPVELGPIRQPKKRKAHTEPDDPYKALGVDAGSFTLYPAIEFIGGYDTNPGRASGGKGAGLYTAAPELQAQSNWSRHELKADLRGSYTGYSPDETPSLNRPYFNGTVDGRVDVSHDTHIKLNARDLVSTDNPGSPNLQAGLSKLPVFTTFGGSLGLVQSFNRFELEAKADAERTVYQNSSLTDGTTASNEDRQYNQFTGTLRGSYELTPGVKPFVEFAADTRKHDLQTDFSGYQRDSNGLTGNVGSTFELSRLLTGEVALGYTNRKYDDPRLEDLNGLVGNASLIWTASALTTVKLTGTTSVGESTEAGVSGVLYRDVGLQVDHAFRRWLIGTAKIGFGQDDYIGIDRLDNRYSAGLGLTYKLNRNLQLKGEVDQYWLRSNISGNNYNDTVFLVGLRLQQ